MAHSSRDDSEIEPIESIRSTINNVRADLDNHSTSPYFQTLRQMGQLLEHYPDYAELGQLAREFDARARLFGIDDAESDAALHAVQAWSHRVARELDAVVQSRYPEVHETDETWRELVASFPPSDRALFSKSDIEKMLTAHRMEMRGLISEVDDMKDVAAENAHEAVLAATRAETAAGSVGTHELEKAFDEYANDNARYAKWYRAAVIVLLLAIVGVAASALTRPLLEEGSLIEAASRLPLVAALAALTAYLGRQAGHHRRRHEWARAINVQLRTFLAFISEMRGESRDRVYEAFGKRVLGEPPESRASSDATSVPLQAVVDMIARMPRS